MKSEFVGIGEAAELLGLSRTSLQKLVDSGQLAAVKTTGGHRRIARSALDALLARMGAGLAVNAEASRHGQPAEAGAVEGRSGLNILLVEDDAVVVAQVQGLIEQYLPGASCAVAGDGLEAVMQLERLRPHVLITDLQMEPFDGFRLMQLVAARPEYRAIAVLVVSSMTEQDIAARGGLPANTVLYGKPLDAARLRGYLEAQAQRVGLR